MKELELLCYICGEKPDEIHLWSLNPQVRNSIFVSCTQCLPRMKSDRPFVLRVTPGAGDERYAIKTSTGALLVSPAGKKPEYDPKENRRVPKPQRTKLVKVMVIE